MAEQQTTPNAGLPLCGCGKPARYETHNGWACNKYFRCLTFEETKLALASANGRALQMEALLKWILEQTEQSSPIYRPIRVVLGFDPPADGCELMIKTFPKSVMKKEGEL